MGIKPNYLVPVTFTRKGSWNASTNTPTLASSTGTEGDVYIVSATGTTSLDGISNWTVNDIVLFASGAWHHAGSVTGGLNAEVQSVKVHISSSAFKASHGSPVQLIAAPGAGKAIALLSAFVQYTYGTVAYVVADRLGIYYHSTVAGLDSALANYQGTSNASILPVPTDVAVASVENKAVDFAAQTSNPTTGDGSFDCYLTYKIITL